MNTLFLTDNTEHPIIINNLYKIYEAQNVIEYSYENFNSWKLKVDGKHSNKHYYFVIDTISSEAFGHWVFESAIYLPAFKELQKLFPGLKLVLKEEKTFKILFCKFFNINTDEITYNIEKDNICFFPSPISSHNDKTITQELKNQIYKFREFFNSESEIYYENIVMPRQTKENYKCNDRQYNFEPLIKQLQPYILNTDEITDLKDQISIIQSGKNIYLSEGSPFLVNGLFCKNKNIFIVYPTPTCIQQEHRYIKIKFIFDLHREFNKVSYLN